MTNVTTWSYTSTTHTSTIYLTSVMTSKTSCLADSDERTSYLGADRRHHWQGLVAHVVANKAEAWLQLQSPTRSHTNEKLEGILSQGSRETLVWDHQTMRFFYSLGLGLGSPERNDLISKNLQKAFGKAQNSRWNRNDRWRWSPCLANTGFRTELSPSAEQVSTQ